MPWLYVQSTGELMAPDGTHAGTGYSGFAAGKNNPAAQNQVGVGPIPCGMYTIGAPQCVPPDKAGPHGPFILPLTPDPANQMFGRAGFLMHGDSIATPGTASHGCIIQERPVRERVAAARLTGADGAQLRVVSSR
jgi:hypothetical protein